MKKLNLKISIGSLILTFATMATVASSAQTAKEMEIQDFKYVATSGGTDWQISFSDKSKYSKSGVPESSMGEVLIEAKKKTGSTSIKRISIPEFPNEDGFFILNLQTLDQPLFLLISRGGELSDTQRRVHLISASCAKPIAFFDATMEEPSDLSVTASANDFKVSFTSTAGKKSEKIWARPESSSSLCTHGFR